MRSNFTLTNMKKIYSLLFLVVSSVSFGQIIADDFNYTNGALLTANGWTAHSGAGTNAIDVGTANGLTYAGYSGTTGFTAAVVGNAALLDQNGEDVNKAFAAPVTSGSIYLSFLVNVTTAVDGYFLSMGTGTTTFFSRFYARPSATAGKINFGIGNSAATYGTADFDPGVTYLAVIKYEVGTAGNVSLWIFPSGIPATEAAAGTPTATATGSGGASVAGVYLRQYSATQNITVDGIRAYATWFNATPCALSLGTATTNCDATTLGLDAYTITIPFTGGNTGAYTLSASNGGIIGGNNPSTTASGNITITGLSEGTGTVLTVSGACAFTTNITAPECKPVNALPYSEPFNYTVGNSLGASQMWTNVNTGDNIVAAAGSLNYAGFSSSANSVTFSGAGIDCFTPFTATTTGTIYTSFIINVTDLTNMGATAETYFAGLTDAARNYRARLFLKRNGTQYQLGLDAASTTTNYETTLRNVGDVVFVVLGYDFATNEIKAWFNPNLGTFTATTTPSLTNTPTAAIAEIGGFLLRQDTATTTPTMVFDELRAALTTAGLLSVAQNEISGLKIYPNPVANGTLFVETALNAEKNIAIYDVLGKQVLSTTTASTEVNVAGLNSGLYLVTITEEGKTATKKLVIR